MVVDAGRLPVEMLADAAAEVAATADLRAALTAIARVAARAASADLAVLRVLDAQGDLAARALAPEGSALGAEVAGTRSACEPIAAGEPSESVRKAARRVGAAGLLTIAARAGGRVVGSVELVRIGTPFDDDDDRAVGELVAAQLALAVRTLAPDGGSAATGRRVKWLELAGEALAAGGDTGRSAKQAVRIAMETSGARAGALWRVGATREPELVASLGAFATEHERPPELVRAALESW